MCVSLPLHMRADPSMLSRSGSVAWTICKKACTCPTITNVFQTEPCSSSLRATSMAGFSRKLRTRNNSLPRAREANLVLSIRTRLPDNLASRPAEQRSPSVLPQSQMRTPAPTQMTPHRNNDDRRAGSPRGLAHRAERDLAGCAEWEEPCLCSPAAPPTATGAGPVP